MFVFGSHIELTLKFCTFFLIYMIVVLYVFCFGLINELRTKLFCVLGGQINLLFFSFFFLLACFFLGATTPTTYITTLYMCIFGAICVYANWTPQLNFITIHLWRERPLEEKSEQETSHVDHPPQFSFWFQCPCFNIQTCDQNPICRDIYRHIYIYG